MVCLGLYSFDAMTGECLTSNLEVRGTIPAMVVRDEVQTSDPWVERLRAGEPERGVALQELWSLLLRSLKRTFADRGQGKLSVDDIAQESLIRILDSLDSFEGRSQFTTWAVTIANRVGISELRRLHYRDVSLDAIQDGKELEIDQVADGAAGKESELEREAVLSALRRGIAESLTDKQRWVIRASLEGLPIEEIARRLGSQRNAVYKLAHDARRRLRSRMEESGVMAHDVAAIIQ